MKFIIIYQNGVPVYIESVDKIPKDMFDVTKAIQEILK